MITNDGDDRNHSGQEDDIKPNAWRVEDNDNLQEKDLEKSLLFNDSENGELNKPVREGEGAGGQNFGKNNLTPAGDDKNNPSQNAGYTNAYFARTEPAEEHPEDSNFTAKQQTGEPDYDKAQPDGTQPDKSAKNEGPKPETSERGNGQNDRPHPQEPYREGTADNGETNIPGPIELPDQQKVGEDADDEREHIET